MTRSDLFRQVCKGNEDAVAFLEAIVQALHFYDDLIDKDQPVSDETVHAIMWSLFIALPRNPFYVRYFDTLNPLLALAIVNWKAANAMEAEGLSLDIAFILRSDYVSLISACAMLCGGPEWAAEVTPEIRRFAHSEGYHGYLQNLRAEKAARGES